MTTLDLDTEIDVMRHRIAQSIEAKQRLLADHDAIDAAMVAVDLIGACLSGGGKVLFAGNGGSSMDAGHLAAELLGRFYVDRAPLAAITLSDATAAVTAIGNDYSYGEVFSRQLTGLARTGDVFFGLTTSGRSENIVKCVQVAQELGVKSVVITGQTGGSLEGLCDVLVRVPCTDTPRVQELSMLIGHSICELVEARFTQQ